MRATRRCSSGSVVGSVVPSVVVAVVVGCAASPARTMPPTLAASSASTNAASSAAPLPTLLLSSEPTTPTLDPLTTLPPEEERPPCVTDLDCWSITCCPATKPQQCVHHALAQKCAVVDVQCPSSEVHVDCICEASRCTGRGP